MTDNPGVGAYVRQDKDGNCELVQFNRVIVSSKNCLTTLEIVAEHISQLEYSRQALMGAALAMIEVVNNPTAAEAHAREHLKSVLQSCKSLSRFSAR